MKAAKSATSTAPAATTSPATPAAPAKATRSRSRPSQGPPAKFEPKLSIVPIGDLSPDGQNANKHTARGMQALTNSLHAFGAARSGVIDRNGVIVAGNATHESAGGMGMNEAIIIETDGTRPVFVKRPDFDLSDPKNIAREYAFVDNHVSEINLNFDVDALRTMNADGVNLSDWLTEDELKKITDDATPGGEPTNPGDGPTPPTVPLVVIFPRDAAHQRELIEKYAAEGLVVRGIESLMDLHTAK